MPTMISFRMLGAAALGLAGAAAAHALDGAVSPAISPTYVEELRDGSYVSSVDDARQDVRFALNGEFHILGRGFANTVNAWILGNRGGGSMLEILRQSDSELVVRVTDIPADEEPWPAEAMPRDDKAFVTVKIVADSGARTFHARLPGAWYDCRAGEPNCE